MKRKCCFTLNKFITYGSECVVFLGFDNIKRNHYAFKLYYKQYCIEHLNKCNNLNCQKCKEYKRSILDAIYYECDFLKILNKQKIDGIIKLIKLLKFSECINICDGFIYKLHEYDENICKKFLISMKLDLPILLFPYYKYNLYNFIKRNTDKFPSKYNVKSIILCLLQSLKEIHNNKIIHCDLKPQNILFNQIYLDLCICKSFSSIFVYFIGDFGNSIFFSDIDSKKGEKLTTIKYRAPEKVLLVDFDSKIDIYSMGCVIYFISTGK